MCCLGLQPCPVCIAGCVAEKGEPVGTRASKLDMFAQQSGLHCLRMAPRLTCNAWALTKLQVQQCSMSQPIDLR